MKTIYFGLPLLWFLTSCGDAPVTPDTEGTLVADTVAVLSPEAAFAKTYPTATLTAQGYGPIRVGMTAAELESAVGGQADSRAATGPDGSTCEEFHPAKAPAGIFVMLEDGKVTRVRYAGQDTIQTDRGVSTGYAAIDVVVAYSRSIRTPHKYAPPPAEYITYWDTGKTDVDYVKDPQARGIRFEVGASGVVEAILVGGPSIQYVEGCF